MQTFYSYPLPQDTISISMFYLGAMSTLQTKPVEYFG